jgi:hypothetical protein
MFGQKHFLKAHISLIIVRLIVQDIPQKVINWDFIFVPDIADVGARHAVPLGLISLVSTSQIVPLRGIVTWNKIPIKLNRVW